MKAGSVEATEEEEKKVKYMRVTMGPWMPVLTISKHKFIHPFNPFNQTENYDSILSTKH